MTVVYQVIVFVISSMVFAFVFANLLLPLIYTLPRFIKLRRHGSLIRPIPYKIIFLTVMMGAVIMLILAYVVYNYLPAYLVAADIGATVALLGILIKYFRKDKELAQDFERTYFSYYRL